ncbi:MAG: YraN family protein [Candidatus Omnitrophota bacterium]
MSDARIYLGRAGEEEAALFLTRNGYKILQKNYRIKAGEIDIVASDGGVICFVEVKTRHSKKFGSPQEAVSELKKRKISRVAVCYLKEKCLLHKKARFDVVSLLVEQGKEIQDIRVIKNAFELDERFSY